MQTGIKDALLSVDGRHNHTNMGQQVSHVPLCFGIPGVYFIIDVHTYRSKQQISGQVDLSTVCSFSPITEMIWLNCPTKYNNAGKVLGSTSTVLRSHLVEECHIKVPNSCFASL